MRNRVQGFSRGWGARELTFWGGAAGSPRRRRGGGREMVLGGVAKGGSSSARKEERRDAWVPARGELMAGKPLHDAGGGAVGGRRREQSREVGDGDKGRFVISKNSRDPTVKQR